MNPNVVNETIFNYQLTKLLNYQFLNYSLPSRFMAKQKTFTLQEAQRLLPVLQALLKRSMEGKQLIGQVEKEWQDLKHRILLSGGLMVDVPVLARRRAERDKALQEIKDALAEIDAIG